MADLRINPASETEVRTRPGEGQYPDYRLGEPMSKSFYGQYESGRDVDYYEADPNLRFVLEGHLEARTMPWVEERLGVLGKRSGHEIVRRADITDEMNHDLLRYDRFGREVSEKKKPPLRSCFHLPLYVAGRLPGSAGVRRTSHGRSQADR